MQTTEFPYTREQYQSLNDEQRAAIDTAAEYLAGDTSNDELTDQQISEWFNILKPTAGCVPIEEIDADIFSAIHRKFRAIYQVGIHLAGEALATKGPRPYEDFSLTLVIDTRRDDASDVAVVDYHRPACYLYEAPKAWEFHFRTLAEIASALLRVKHHLVERVLLVARPREIKESIYVRVENGAVQDVVGIPPGIELVVLDYDVDDLEPERLQLSPLDQEVCCISRFEGQNKT